MECIIREATIDDCEHLMGLIQEIATYHHLENEITINAQVLKADGFGKDPFFKCLLAEQPGEKGCKPGRPIGHALYFFGYSVNHGKMLYLENLYVVSEFRGKGIGMELLRKVAENALATGCMEMKFMTMDWNRRAKAFYERLGAHDTTESEDFHCMELGRDALERLVQKGSKGQP
ncbi:thialysine N-epsilon-acetyltransferase-like [Sceloporus undulatus]|uniref:thialysine N-epsilon-acetyltransferase-like n=1 Tax=Sceloporus undulatus TaxID=8520 RepID=UPI001C4C0636|nr:thialysine N-epsilon-acetyltransferase-like [Sceloporus undulatus]